MAKKTVGILLSVMLGLVFIYSGFSKLVPLVETFEFTFVDLGVASWKAAPVIARLFIGLEFFTGLLLVACFRLRKTTLPLTIFLLIFFSMYLIAQLITQGNSGNCGCFGEHLRMTPMQGLLKNVFLLGLCIVTFLLYEGWTMRRFSVLLILAALPAFVLPFVLNPVDYTYTSNNLDEKVNYPVGIENLYIHNDSGKVERPAVDLRQGKHVVAFLSLTCSHCRVAAKKLRLIRKENPSLPIYFVLNGDKADYSAFVEDTRADNVPHSFCSGKTFVQLAGNVLPRIYYLDNGIVVKKVDYYEVSQSQIEEWLAKP